MSAGTLEMVDLEQLFEESLHCTARKDGCPNEAAWRTCCPMCGVEFLWCDPCRLVWLARWNSLRLSDVRATCPKCPYQTHCPPAFIPLG